MRWPMSERAAVASATWHGGLPSMKVSVPARAPTTPPDMGASRKVSALLVRADTSAATARDVDGSMVEQSMKRRGFAVGWAGEDGGEGGGEGVDGVMASYTLWTCSGCGSTVITVSW